MALLSKCSRGDKRTISTADSSGYEKRCGSIVEGYHREERYGN